MKPTLALTALLCSPFLSGLPAFGADAQLLNLVMPDAKVLAGVNVTSAKNSPLGQFLLSRLPNGLPAGLPVGSVTEILAASAADPAVPGGLLAMRGTFHPDQIVAALSALPNAPAYQVQTYAGATLIVFTNPKTPENSAVAFLGGDIALAGHRTAVTAALDRSTGTNALDPALAAEVRTLSGSEDAWLVSSVSPASLAPGKLAAAAGQTNPMAGQVSGFLSNIQGFSGGVKLGETVPVTFDLVANTPQNAEAMGNLVKFLLSMANVNAQGSANPQAAAALALLQTMQINTDGSKLDLALSIPEAQIESLISSLPKPAARGSKISAPLPVQR